jgi:hypothetical protein
MKDKIEWLENWCKIEGLALVLEGVCGFGRECVGVASLNDGTYPDYVWYNDNYGREDKNGEVWCPQNAYHKHPCTAVLGRGEEAVQQLYNWCKWFEAHGFHYKKEKVVCNDPIELMLGRAWQHRMVKDV